jgi:hypothetical protein
MKPSRLILVAGIFGAIYAPGVFADSSFDMVSSTQYETGSGMDTIHEMIVPDVTAQMTRASFTQMVVDHLYTPAQIDHCYWDIAPSLPPTFTLLYTDVPTSASYGKELCIALRDGLATGFKDGSFHPNDMIHFTEASKILSKAYALAPYAEINQTGNWYAPYAFAVANRNAIPETVTTYYHTMTTAEVMDMLDRLSNNITWRTATSYEDIDHSSQQPIPLKPRVTEQTTATNLKTGSTSSLPSLPTSSMPSSMPTSASTSSTQPWYKLF